MSIKEELCVKEDITELSKKIAAKLREKFKTVLETTQEIESEVVVILLERKESFCKKEQLTFNYILLSVRNALIDRYFRVKESSVVKVSIEDEENPIDVEEKRELSPVSLLAVREAFEILKESLTKSEYEILCYYFFSVLYRKEENPFLEEKSEAARYKAWSRLKPKVQEILKDFELEEEEMKKLGFLVTSDCLSKKRL
jgi:hypothetical protein